MQSSLSGSTTQQGFVTGHTASPLSSSWKGQCHGHQNTPTLCLVIIMFALYMPKVLATYTCTKSCGLNRVHAPKSLCSKFARGWVGEMKAGITLVVFPLCQHVAHSDIKNSDVISFPTYDRRNKVSQVQPPNASIHIKTKYKGIKKSSCFLFF